MNRSEIRFIIDYRSWRAAYPCRRRNKLTADDRIEAWHKCREFLRNKHKV